MKRFQFYAVSLLILCGCLIVSTIEATACYPTRNPSPNFIVENADVIVRATAIEFIENEGVRFRVEEVLKGENVPSALVFTGHLSDRDDYNDQLVPYQHVRSSWSVGHCYAYEYRRGAEFLLVLKRRDENLTPYWSPLAPTNEQLRSADDAWLLWVRNHLQFSQKEKAKAENTFFWLYCLSVGIS